MDWLSQVIRNFAAATVVRPPLAGVKVAVAFPEATPMSIPLPTAVDRPAPVARSVTVKTLLPEPDANPIVVEVRVSLPGPRICTLIGRGLLLAVLSLAVG